MRQRVEEEYALQMAKYLTSQYIHDYIITIFNAHPSIKSAVPIHDGYKIVRFFIIYK